MIKICETDIEYPPTKVQFSPDTSVGAVDLIAVGGLRAQLLEIQGSGMVRRGVLQSGGDGLSPCTSLDWNNVNKDRLGTCSLDTTVTVWSVTTCQPVKKLIAHDKEVYDINFSPNPDIFGTVGGDGSLRVFDLRSLEHSTILYESPDLTPLVRVGWNQYDANFVCTIGSGSNKIVVIDTRKPTVPYCELSSHTSNVNSVSWSPHSSTHLCSCSTDRKALIWDLYPIETSKPPRILQYEAEGAVNDVKWCGINNDLIAMTVGTKLQCVRI